MISKTEAKVILGVSADSKFDSMHIQPAGETPCGYKLYSKKALEEFMERTLGVKSAEEIKANYYNFKEVSIILDENSDYLRRLIHSGYIVFDLQLCNHHYYFSRENIEGIAESIGKVPNWEAVPAKGMGVR